MKNIKYVDLENTSDERLNEMSIGLGYSLLEDKKIGISKIWYENSGVYIVVVAWCNKGDDTIQIHNPFIDALKKMTEVKPKVDSFLSDIIESVSSKKNEETSDILEVDVILDKISSQGIDSLSTKEKTFLNNL